MIESGKLGDISQFYMMSKYFTDAEETGARYPGSNQTSIDPS